MRINGACIDWIRSQEVIKTRVRKRLTSIGEFVPIESQLHDFEDSDRLRRDRHEIDHRSADPSDASRDRDGVESVLRLFRPGRDRDVMRLHFVHRLDMKTVGMIVGVTESRVSQIIKAATERARLTLARL